MRLAIIGYGGVGRAFVQLLKEKKAYLNKEGIFPQVKYIIDLGGGIYNPKGVDCSNLVEFIENGGAVIEYPHGGSTDITFEKLMENRDVDFVIEMTPTNKKTGEPGMTFIKKSLENGINVITSDKGPVLLAYKELNQLAVKNHVQLGIGCTTGGALPSINGGIIDMAGANICSIEGVLNGTTNFILKEMKDSKITYQKALKKAQELGIAETDPTLDVEGWDTATKLLILTNVLMDQEKTLEDISVEGITHITQEDINKTTEEGKILKLVGKTEKMGRELNMTVKLEKLDSDHPLYGVEGKNKAVRYTSDTLGDLTVIGGASGVIPAAASVLRDLINIHRGYRFSR